MKETAVDYVRVSQGSRQMAKPPELPRFDSYREEYEWWLARLQQLNTSLAAYSKSARNSEQLRIRREFRNDEQRSFVEWMKRRDEMERERAKILPHKNAAEFEVARLKPLMKAKDKREASSERASRLIEEGRVVGKLEDAQIFRSDGILDLAAIAAHILIELRAIRAELKAKD